MSDCMDFPDTWEEFVDSYAFKDDKEWYTNGSMLIPVFRVKQMVEHYFKNEKKDVFETSIGKVIVQSHPFCKGCTRFAADARTLCKTDEDGKTIWIDHRTIPDGARVSCLHLFECQAMYREMKERLFGKEEPV